MNINGIISELQTRVLKGDAISPASWVEAALRVNILGEDMDNELAKMENMMLEIEAQYVKTDMSSAKAKTLAKSEIDYEEYLQLKAKKLRIDEFIKLAKKRSTIENI
jgi:hypothetical protein